MELENILLTEDQKIESNNCILCSGSLKVTNREMDYRICYNCGTTYFKIKDHWSHSKPSKKFANKLAWKLIEKEFFEKFDESHRECFEFLRERAIPWMNKLQKKQKGGNH